MAAAGELAAVDALVRAYPESLAGYDSMDLIWRDGTRMPLSDGRPAKSFAEMLRRGSLLDQLRLPYPAGLTPAAFARDDDPGRVRQRRMGQLGAIAALGGGRGQCRPVRPST